MASHHHMVVRSIAVHLQGAGAELRQYLPAGDARGDQRDEHREDGRASLCSRSSLRSWPSSAATFDGTWTTYCTSYTRSGVPTSCCGRCFAVRGTRHRAARRVRRHLPDLLPRMIAVLAAAGEGQLPRRSSVLHALEEVRKRGGRAPAPHAPRAGSTLSAGRRAGAHRHSRSGAPILTVLLPRMQLADHASAVVHPLVRVLDGPVKELRRDALVALTSLANSLGQDFLLFLPLVRRTKDGRCAIHLRENRGEARGGARRGGHRRGQRASTRHGLIVWD